MERRYFLIEFIRQKQVFYLAIAGNSGNIHELISNALPSDGRIFAEKNKKNQKNCQFCY